VRGGPDDAPTGAIAPAPIHDVLQARGGSFLPVQVTYVAVNHLRSVGSVLVLDGHALEFRDALAVLAGEEPADAEFRFEELADAVPRAGLGRAAPMDAVRAPPVGVAAADDEVFAGGLDAEAFRGDFVQGDAQAAGQGAVAHENGGFLAKGVSLPDRQLHSGGLLHVKLQVLRGAKGDGKGVVRHEDFIVAAATFTSGNRPMPPQQKEAMPHPTRARTAEFHS